MQRRGFSLINQKMSKLRGFELENLRYFGIFIQHFVRGFLVWSLCSRVLKFHIVNEYILQMCNVEVSVWSTKNCRNYGGLNLDVFEIFWDIYTHFVRGTVVWSLCPRVMILHKVKEYIADVQRRGFSLIDRKLRNYVGLNLVEFEIFV